MKDKQKKIQDNICFYISIDILYLEVHIYKYIRINNITNYVCMQLLFYIIVINYEFNFFLHLFIEFYSYALLLCIKKKRKINIYMDWVSMHICA